MPFFADLDRLKAELDALRPLPPEQEQRVMQKFRLEWNYNSNAIEGNSLTLGETRSLLLHGLTAQGKPLRDHLDIKGHNEAVLWLEDIVRDDRPLTEQFVRGMHQVLLGEPYEVPAQTADGQPTRKRIVPGQYKTAPNHVLTATGEMFYYATVEETPARMTDLVDWYRRETEQPTLHPVALAAEFHYRFVRIHPFDDGNGRMSRLLMNLILIRAGYPITVIKADDRNRYLAALAQADAGEPEPFLRFIIENVAASLRLMIRAAKGESVDEPSDLDKKLALLRVQLADVGNKERLLWSPNVQQDFLDNYVKLWFVNLTTQSERFDFAFTTKSYRVGAFSNSTGQKGFFRMSPVSSGIWQVFEQSFYTDEVLSALNFFVCWEVFKKDGSLVDLTMGVRFRFDRSEFRLFIDIDDRGPDQVLSWEFPDRSRVFSSNYKKQYPTASIAEVNRLALNKVADFIAAKLAEADAPPPQP